MIPFDPGDVWSYTNDPAAPPPSTASGEEIIHVRRQRALGRLFAVLLLLLVS